MFKRINRVWKYSVYIKDKTRTDILYETFDEVDAENVCSSFKAYFMDYLKDDAYIGISKEELCEKGKHLYGKIWNGLV